MFGFCITHILNTGCAKVWKKKSVAKRLKLCHTCAKPLHSFDYMASICVLNCRIGCELGTTRSVSLRSRCSTPAGSKYSSLPQRAWISSGTLRDSHLIDPRGPVPGCKAGCGVQMTTQRYLMPSSRKCGALLPLPHMPYYKVEQIFSKIY